MKDFLLLISALTVLAAPPAFASADAENGKVIYEKLCWWCHGRKGEGDGPGAAADDSNRRVRARSRSGRARSPHAVSTPVRSIISSVISQ